MSDRRLSDMQLRCTSCGHGFVFSAGEQELCRLRGIATKPDYCPNCARGRVLTGPRVTNKPSS